MYDKVIIINYILNIPLTICWMVKKNCNFFLKKNIFISLNFQVVQQLEITSDIIIGIFFHIFCIIIENFIYVPDSYSDFESHRHTHNPYRLMVFRNNITIYKMWMLMRMNFFPGPYTLTDRHDQPSRNQREREKFNQITLLAINMIVAYL